MRLNIKVTYYDPRQFTVERVVTYDLSVRYKNHTVNFSTT